MSVGPLSPGRAPARGAGLLERLLAVPAQQRDAWVDALLGLGEGVPDDGPGLPPGTVPYLPCDVDAIVRALTEAPVTERDVFVDLGAGLGRPALLANLLTGARCIGVELQPHLVARAREAAARLGRGDVRFLEGDATRVDVSEGTVFFIYSSFNGPALGRVLAKLRDLAGTRRLVLCAVDFEVQEEWLTPRRCSSPSVVFYDSR